MVMNTTSFHQIVEHRVFEAVDKTDGVNQRELNQLVVRQSNGLLLERRLNRSLWTRIYKNRVFIYNINTNRAVVELGCIGIETDNPPLYGFFVLYMMGGIHNNKVRDNLLDYVRVTN